MRIYSYLNTSVIRKTENCVEARHLLGGVSSVNIEFFQFPRVLIKLHRYTEKIIYISFIIWHRKIQHLIEEQREIFRDYFGLCKHGSQAVSDQNS